MIWLATNWLSLLALIVAVIVGVPAFKALKRADHANSLSRKSNDLATQANRKADEANELSRQANRTADEDLALQKEVHDVTWDWAWIAVGTLVLRNESSRSDAHKVVLVVTFDGHEQMATEALVQARGGVDFNFPEAVRMHTAEKRQEREQRSSPFFLGSTMPSTHSVTWRADWVTELGAPRHAESKADLVWSLDVAGRDVDDGVVRRG